MRLLIVLVLTCSTVFAADVWIALTPNDDNGYTDGYKIYRRKEGSTGYSFQLDVGKETNIHILDLDPEKVYYFAASSYTQDDREGVLSQEVKATPKATPPPTPRPTATPAPLPRPQLVNVSTRAKVGTGADVVIAGFVVADYTGKFCVRALGPTLAKAGITGALADPIIELYSKGKKIGSNNDWKVPNANKVSLEALGMAPPNDKESALVVMLAPGSYSVVLSGVNGTTGVGLVEVYKLNQ